MNKTILTLLFLAIVSCKHKEPTKSDYMQRAIRGDDYKMVQTNFQRVKDSLDVMKNRRVDTTAVIYEYNIIAGSSTVQAKTIAQVIRAMNDMSKDSSFLKTVQKHLADTLEKNHRDSTKNSN